MAGMNILIVGVGGQGTLLASRIIGNVVNKKGYDVKVSEVHGMSQRGGSVETYVRYADEKVSSPIIGEGEADVILAFECLEAYRSLKFLKKGGRLIVNTQQIDPMPVITGAAVYPKEIVEKMKRMEIRVDALDAQAAAREAGNEKAVNVVLIGLLAAASDIPKQDWLDGLKETVRAKFLDVNVRAFEIGYALYMLCNVTQRTS